MSVLAKITSNVSLVTVVAFALIIITCGTLATMNMSASAGSVTNKKMSTGKAAKYRRHHHLHPPYTYSGDQPLVRYVRVSTTSPPLVLGQVEVFVGNTNVAPINGNTRQSSTHDNNIMFHGPQLAINGDLSATGFGGGDASRTKKGDSSPWWEVDLGSEMPINQVNLWLQDRGRFPNPNPIWYLNNDVQIYVQLLCNRKNVKWSKWVHKWEDVVTIQIE